MLDVLITGGTVVDGTGRPGRRADVGIKDGRVVAVGPQASGSGGRRIEADGLVVAPGFVDIHTHYDAQIMWDPWVTPSSLNGVTTVIGGNCGFSVAPMTEDTAEYILPTFARVEGMSLRSLETGLDLKWSSFGEWLERLDGHLGLNAGFSVGHSTLRRLVMGERAVGGAASDADLSSMCAALDRSLDEGALGFTSSWGPSHFDMDGAPVPSRHADEAELLSLAAVLDGRPGTSLEFIPFNRPVFGPAQYEVMTRMALAARRPLNWNLLVVKPGEAEREFRRSAIEACEFGRRAGATVKCLGLPQPVRFRLNLLTGVLYDTSPGWADVMHLPLAEKRLALQQPSVRAALAAGARSEGYHEWTDWAALGVADVGRPDHQRYVGRTFGDIARERGVDPFDALCDIAIEDDLRTGIAVPVLGEDDEHWRIRADLLRDARVLPGGSDAGAHLDMMMTWACYVELLAEAVRSRGLLTLEEAVHLITDVPARYYGLVDRGRIEVGAWADIVIFDPDSVGPGPSGVRDDLPGGGWRLYSEAEGIVSTLVNGVEIASDGTLTGALPGVALRSGLDTV